jgi:hypothetical protein
MLTAMRRVRNAAIATLVAAGGAAAVTAQAVPPSAVSHAAATRIVVHGKLERLKGRTATYSSRQGTFSATRVGRRHYRIRGRIGGLALTGSFRTRQTTRGDRYRASGSGRLGGRPVRISGGGANDLSRATLVLI